METTTMTTRAHPVMIALMAFGCMAGAACGDDGAGDTMVSPSADGGLPTPSVDGGSEPEPEPCPTGMTGTTCMDCAPGFQDEDGDGFCELGCNATGAEALDCGNGSCDDGTGSRECLCDEGYAGSTCGECATGYSLVADGCVGDLSVVEGLALWFDATSTSMTVNEAGEVTAMSSLSADFTMVGASGDRPTFVEDGLGGRPAVLFDADDERLYSTGSTDALAGDDYTVFWVGARQGLVSGQALFSYRTGSDYGAFVETSGAGLRFVHRSPIGTVGGNQTIALAPSGQPVQIVRALRSGSAVFDTLQVAIAEGTDLSSHSDAEELTTDAIGGTHAFVIGAGPDQSFRGHFGELLVYDRLLTAAETDAVMAYLNEKWVD